MRLAGLSTDVSTPVAVSSAGQLVPQPITAADIAVSADLRAFNRLKDLFQPHQDQLYKPLLFIHNAASKNNLTTLNKEDLLPAVHAYLGLMLCAQGTNQTFDSKKALLQGAIEMTINPNRNQPMLDTVKRYLSEERWPAAYKTDPDIADILAEELLTICTNHGYKFRDDGDLDIKAIDLLRAEVFPVIKDTAPRLIDAINHEEDSYPARCVAIARIANPPPLQKQPLVAIGRDKAEEMIGTLAIIPDLEAAAKTAGITEGIETGSQRARTDLQKILTETRAAKTRAETILARSEALGSAPRTLLESGFAVARPLLEKRMAYLLSSYFRELFGDAHDNAAVVLVTRDVAQSIVSYLPQHLRATPLNNEADLRKIEYQIILTQLPRIIEKRKSEFVKSLSDSVLAAFSTDQETQAFDELFGYGMARVEGLASCIEVVDAMLEEQSEEHKRPPQAAVADRTPLDLLRECAAKFDGAENKKKVLLKNLNSNATRGAALQAIIEASLRENAHCTKLLASDEYVIESRHVAWGKDYSHKHITDRQLVTLAQLGNKSAIAILRASVESGYHKDLQSTATGPFTPLHPKLMLATVVLALSSDPAISSVYIDKIRDLTMPTIDEWEKHHTLFEILYHTTQIALLAATLTHSTHQALRIAINHFKDEAENIKSADLKAINTDNSIHIIDKIMTGLFYGRYRKLPATAGDSSTEDSTVTVAREMETLVMDDNPTCYIDGSEAATVFTASSTAEKKTA